MLFFRSEEHVAQWKRERGVATGAVISLEKVWEMSKVWYGNRLDHAYDGRSLEEAQEIFRGVGLTAGFWYM